MKPLFNRIALLSLCTLLCALGMSACAAHKEAQPVPDGSAQQTNAQQELAPTPAPTAEPVHQSGALDAVLLDGVLLRAVAKSYRFLENDCIGVTVAAQNANGNPATVWLLLTGVNGWDVRNQQQAMQSIRLAPGEERSLEILFDLTEQRAQYLRLGALTELTFTTEGYVDSTDYEFAMQQSAVSVSDAPEGYVQRYADGDARLLDNDLMTLAYCGQDADSGEMTLYYEIKKAAEGASCRLYPLENGIFDTQRYPVLEELDMSAVTKRLITFLPAEADAATALDGFYAVVTGAEMQPTLLALPAKSAAGALRQTLDAMERVAQNEWLSIYYDANSRRFFAENRTKDRTVTLENEAEFLLDGLSVRANPQTVPCFPQSATAFRISGRGKDADGMERNRVVDEASKTVSVSWLVRPFSEAATNAGESGTIATGELTLLD